MVQPLSGSQGPRDRILERFHQDLVGPWEPQEVLDSRPSDVYLTGILWPKNTRVAPEEDERLSMAPGDGEEGEESADSGQATSVPQRRPSTAGLSFAARSTKDGTAPCVIVSVTFGLYVEGAQNGQSVWQRRPVEPEPISIVLTSGVQDFPLGAGPDGLRLNVRSVPFDRGMLTTVTLVNGCTPAARGRAALEQITLFQVHLDVTADPDSELIARPSRRTAVDEDDCSAALVYRSAKEFAAGHTCSADWDDPSDDEAGHTQCVRTAWLPQATVPAVSPEGHDVFRHLKVDDSDPLSAEWLARASAADRQAGLGRLCDAYSRWLGMRQQDARSLPAEFASTAERHLADVRNALSRMQAGVSRLASDPNAAAAFRLANLAMCTQARWNGNPVLRWRPFQLGFVLLSFESCIDGAHPDRAIMDLLWFPTGGGKTEAYLALIAMVAFSRRLSRKNPDAGAGVAVLMRYTLRLLTTQQFMRAAAMICACEAIRRGRIPADDAQGLGEVPFSIGLWVGEGATPNTRALAFESWNDPGRPSPRQLPVCPACHAQLNYVQAARTDAVEVSCLSRECVMGGAPIPVWTVDEDVYHTRPTLLIGTVDKFAQIVRNAKTSALFGVGSGAQPQLILQDELHLISGPLGTISGLYETAIDLILSADGSRPKIIGSTATIRRARDQVRALFDRETCQFPPAGLDANDSGFAVTDFAAPGRRYVGVTTAGRSAKFTLQSVSAVLLQSAAALPAGDRDAYWTLLAYFNSLRELGGALVLTQDDVNDTLRLLAARHGEPQRAPRAVEELTSRRTQQEISGMLRLLAIQAGEEGALDVVLATNMVSVGVDIPRLGLMVVNGQPKTMAEYIQATSRVGRGRVNGLVVPVLNAAKPRDRSHFETFRTWHDTLYREVEATSVTPFASRARDRALHAVLVAVVRHLMPGMLDSPALDDAAIMAAEALIERIAERARRVDPLEAEVGDELRERLQRWLRRRPRHYWAKPKESLLQSAEHAAARRAAGRAVGQAWPTPNTMRGVEPATPYRLAERLRVERDA